MSIIPKFLSGDNEEIEINGKSLKCMLVEPDDNDSLCAWVKPNLNDLKNTKRTDIPESVSFLLTENEGFNCLFFSELFISESGKNFELNFYDEDANKSIFFNKADIDNFYKIVDIDNLFSSNILDGSVTALLNNDYDDLYMVIDEITRRLEIIFNRVRSLQKFVWEKDYEKNEKLFTNKVVAPLLRKLEFLSVKLTHGTKEYGKDFIVSELNKLGDKRYCAIQVKAGNVNGGVNSQIDELLGQINDAFSMPFKDLATKNDHYISELIILISGKFTENAKEKIIHKTPRNLLGSVSFIDQDDILTIMLK